ncbi:flagellar biosynthesis protein FlhB [Erwinia sorbitola]|uniref:Flagellar biosynthetic protein FlhB n=1 Tax=Erwinia sorbitola TaxID=2681984 RepID=A0A6I6F3V5_9GAMM|nr:flagellar biosynthesis protein FlhB [Erwinia sorbitola]MTD26979.1 flagellar type III secretion system protein FlhB [Erwinia sorbitola]QGU88540.1 flagellar type III secretion system protein FlhB [Erwinia sorbitola]
MSASSGDKSEKPSARKLNKSRKKGDIPRSRDVTMAAGLVASLAIISTFFPYYREQIQASFTAVNQMASRIHDDGALHQFMLTQVLIILKILATLVPIPLIACLATLVPGGWIFAPGRIKPDFKKLNPISGAKRMVGKQHLTDVLKMIVKCAVVLGLLWSTIQDELPVFMTLQSHFLHEAISEGFTHYAGVIKVFVITIALFAFIDVPLSKYLFIKKMRMTKKEVRDEHKNQEGNPQIKGRIRQLQRQMSMGLINQQVPQADVVIVNPTHYAVALKYAPDKAAAPYIVAKGLDEIALHIRAVARQHKIEVVEFPPLARSIYYSTRVNQQVPASLYRAIAQVLTYVMQLKSWRSGQGEQPHLDLHIPLPENEFEKHGNV